jgi:hypothetical protein
MAQENQGLALRGLILLAVIGGLVTLMLGFMFWQSHTPPPTLVAPPEHQIPSLAAPNVGAFPSGISWYAIYQLGETMPSAPGWEVRYNAATTLARRGSAAVPWALLREMLDEKLQMRNYRVRHADGRDVYDEAAARANTVRALKALAVWHEKRKAEQNLEVPSDLAEIYAMVDKLATSPFVELKIQAEKARGSFFR